MKTQAPGTCGRVLALLSSYGWAGPCDPSASGALAAKQEDDVPGVSPGVA